MRMELQTCSGLWGGGHQRVAFVGECSPPAGVSCPLCIEIKKREEAVTEAMEARARLVAIEKEKS